MTTRAQYEDLDASSWRELGERLRLLARPGELQVEILVRLIREGAVLPVQDVVGTPASVKHYPDRQRVLDAMSAIEEQPWVDLIQKLNWIVQSTALAFPTPAVQRFAAVVQDEAERC
jgi:hypothetical protein